MRYVWPVCSRANVTSSFRPFFFLDIYFYSASTGSKIFENVIEIFHVIITINSPKIVLVNIKYGAIAIGYHFWFSLIKTWQFASDAADSNPIGRNCS